MADEGKLCVCPQCGKKYKLKEGFDAKSFSCKACGATVWVAGKPPAPAPTAKAAGGASTAARKGGRGGQAAAASTGRRPRGREEAASGRRHGHATPKSGNKNIWIAAGLVAAVGVIGILATMGGDEPTKRTDEAPANVAATTGTPTEKPVKAPVEAPPVKPPVEKPVEGTPETGGEEPAPSPEGGETPTKLGGEKKPGETAGKHDPPATLGHLDTTPPEQRKQIDEFIGVLFDVDAGRASHDAKAKLAAIGKPAFLPILGKMATIRDTITDDDSMPERLIESSLMLADQCLREMDGYLDAKEKGIIRPGTDKKYIKYVLVLHYRRWNDGLGSQPLKDMETMPGAFDPTKLPAGGDEEEEEAGK